MTAKPGDLYDGHEPALTWLHRNRKKASPSSSPANSTATPASPAAS